MLKPLLVLGRCSYSYYILHGAVIYFILFLILNFANFLLQNRAMLISVIIFVFVFPITFLLSLFTEKYIESPFNKLGNYFSKKLANR